MIDKALWAMTSVLAQTGEAAEGEEAMPDIAEALNPDNLMRIAETYGVPLLKALVLLLAALIVASWTSRIVRRGLEKAKFDLTLTKFFATLIRWTILVLAIIGILGMFGFQTTSFAAVIGGAALAIGLAMQGSLGNLAAGVMLLVFRPYKVGDVINTGGVIGKVDELELFTTSLDTFDNRRIIVPNGAIFGSTIENISYHSIRRVDVAVGVSYSADIDKTREVLMAAAEGVPGRSTEREPAVVLGDLGDSAVGWTVRVWAAGADFWGVKEATTRAIKMALDEAGISIPFPQRDVHVYKQE